MGAAWEKINPDRSENYNLPPSLFFVPSQTSALIQTFVQISWPGSIGIDHTKRHEKTPNPCYLTHVKSVVIRLGVSNIPGTLSV